MLAHWGESFPKRDRTPAPGEVMQHRLNVLILEATHWSRGFTRQVFESPGDLSGDRRRFCTEFLDRPPGRGKAGNARDGSSAASVGAVSTPQAQARACSHLNSWCATWYSCLSGRERSSSRTPLPHSADSAG